MDGFLMADYHAPFVINHPTMTGFNKSSKGANSVYFDNLGNRERESGLAVFYEIFLALFYNVNENNLFPTFNGDI